MTIRGWSSISLSLFMITAVLVVPSASASGPTGDENADRLAEAVLVAVTAFANEIARGVDTFANETTRAAGAIATLAVDFASGAPDLVTGTAEAWVAAILGFCEPIFGTGPCTDPGNWAPWAAATLVAFATATVVGLAIGATVTVLELTQMIIDSVQGSPLAACLAAVVDGGSC